MTDVEARARLDSMLSFLEHEADALHALGNPRLAEVLVQIASLRAEIAATVAGLEDGPGIHGRPPSLARLERNPAEGEHRRRPRPVRKRHRLPRWAWLLIALFVLTLIWLSLQTVGSHGPSGTGLRHPVGREGAAHGSRLGT